MNRQEMHEAFRDSEREAVVAEIYTIAGRMAEYSERLTKLADRMINPEDVAQVVNEVENLMRNLNLSTVVRRAVSWSMADQRCVGDKV